MVVASHSFAGEGLGVMERLQNAQSPLRMSLPRLLQRGPDVDLSPNQIHVLNHQAPFEGHGFFIHLFL